MHKSSRRQFLQFAGCTLAGTVLGRSLGWAIESLPGVTQRATLWSMGGWNFMEVTAPTAPIATEAVLRAKEAIRTIDRTFSVFDHRTPLAHLNNADSLLVPIDRSLMANGLTTSLEWARRTDGAFDPTVEPLMRRWGFRTAPSSPGLAGGRTFDYRSVEYDRRRDVITREFKAISFDSGGWAKGLAAQRAAEAALAAGAQTVQINCGCDLYRKDPRGDAWECLVRDPYGRPQDIALRCRQRWPAVATSANTESFRIGADGTRHGHLMDPRTGAPAHTDLESVTVFADDGLAADALASALFVMGTQSAHQWLARHPEFGAILLQRGWDRDPQRIHVHGDLKVRRAA